MGFVIQINCNILTERNVDCSILHQPTVLALFYGTSIKTAVETLYGAINVITEVSHLTCNQILIWFINTFMFSSAIYEHVMPL